jgi:hypothetical protein
LNRPDHGNLIGLITAIALIGHLLALPIRFSANGIDTLPDVRSGRASSAGEKRGSHTNDR